MWKRLKSWEFKQEVVPYTIGRWNTLLMASYDILRAVRVNPLDCQYKWNGSLEVGEHWVCHWKLNCKTWVRGHENHEMQVGLYYFLLCDLILCKPVILFTHITIMVDWVLKTNFPACNCIINSNGKNKVSTKCHNITPIYYRSSKMAFFLKPSIHTTLHKCGTVESKQEYNKFIKNARTHKH